MRINSPNEIEAMNNLYWYISFIFLCSCINTEKNDQKINSEETSEEITTNSTNIESSKSNELISNQSSNISINGLISGANKMNYYLYYIGNQKPQILDTCIINNNQLVFNTPLPHEYNLLGFILFTDSLHIR